MLAALIAAIAIIAPPAKYDKGVADYDVELVPFARVTLACEAIGMKLTPLGPTEVRLGCTNAAAQVMVIPAEDASFPYAHDCWVMNIRHEGAHANGWPANHPGGTSFVCYPK